LHKPGRTDLSGVDSACIGSTLRSLTQVTGELQSYEYLITIESQLDGFGDDNAMRGILRLAVENALKILDIEHRHLSELSDQCSRYPLSADETKQAMQFIESTAAILKSIQPRLWAACEFLAMRCPGVPTLEPDMVAPRPAASSCWGPGISCTCGPGRCTSARRPGEYGNF
jgi:hypothetical protein